MPISGIPQPEVIPVCDTIHLRRYDGKADFALEWYQDKYTLLMVDGKNEPYTIARLYKMYRYLDQHGELYFIEQLHNSCFVPIGDVTLCRDDLPIVIGSVQLRGCGIGRLVLNTLIQRARSLGFKELRVREIYDNNLPSRRLFESVGFLPCKSTENGRSYYLAF